MNVRNDVEIHFHEQNTASVYFESYCSGNEEKVGEIANVVFYTIRMLSNLGKNVASNSLARLLLKVPIDMVKIASNDISNDLKLIMHPGHSGKKYFISTLRLTDKIQYVFKAKGFGFLGKGLNYYGPTSVLAFIQYLTHKRQDDKIYLGCLANSISHCGHLYLDDEISLTNQYAHAMAILFSSCGLYVEDE